MNAAFFVPAFLFIGLAHFLKSHYVQGESNQIAMAIQDVQIENTYQNRLGKLTIESRSSKLKKNRNRKNKGGGGPAKPIDVQVTFAGNTTVTIATFGTNTTTYQMNYTGNWSKHDKCLMPCNPRYPDPCKNIPGVNCTCLARKDFPATGTCALVGATPGNSDYKTSEK
ncbi:hypothetical protein MRX96_043575 [Rhipicephalus microplus]